MIFKGFNSSFIFYTYLPRRNGRLSESFSIKIVVRKGCPLSSILFNLFINDICNKYDKYRISIGYKHCSGGFFSSYLLSFKIRFT